MRTENTQASWVGFFGGTTNKLSFSKGAVHTVAEMRDDFFRSTQWSTLWAPISSAVLFKKPMVDTSVGIAQLAALSAAYTGQLLNGQTLLIFNKSSDFEYPKECLDNQVVTYLQTNCGTPPAQVKWFNGYSCWVEWADLRRLLPDGFRTASDIVLGDSRIFSHPGCAALRAVQHSDYTCETCLGRYKTSTHSAYGHRDSGGTNCWTYGACPADLSHCPESPSARWCTAACEAMSQSLPPRPSLVSCNNA
jgi:hypothetical protein